MKYLSAFLALLLVGTFPIIADEQANIKIALNSKVLYELELKIDARQKLPEGEAEIVFADSEQKFDLVIQKENDLPVLLLTPKDSWFKLSAGAFTLHYDSTELKDNAKHAFWKKISQINNETVKVPLTQNQEFLSKPSREYPILPMSDPQGFAENVGPILDLINNGLTIGKDNNIKYDTEYEGGAIHASSVVSKISEKEVVIESLINWNGKEALNDPKADVIHKGEGKALITIDRSNLLVTHVEAEVTVNISTQSADKSQAIPILSDGEVIAKINFTLSPKKWNKD